MLVSLCGCVARPASRGRSFEDSESSAPAAPRPELAPAPAPASLSAAERLRERFGPQGFTVLEEAPFVVLGNEAPEVVRRRSKSTVAWAVAKLKAAYFERDPDALIEVWLFADERSYRSYAVKLFGGEPGTPFGYYSAEHNALVMNISTGGGTLVHEIVHPFMEANFPRCPAWFDEGLASLYEGCDEREGEIHGLVNWRLPGLQAAIADASLPSFRELTSTTRDEFYDHDPGTNYAQARYLCYYLQEQGLLRRYYREFVANVAADPTGYATLKKVLNTNDMTGFQQRWHGFVRGLSFG